MKEIDSHSSVERSSEKSFGIVFSIVFLIIALYPLTNSEEIRLWAIIISATFLLLAFVAPQVLATPNKFWFKFGILLGSIISPVVMALVYFLTVLPTGLIMRFLARICLSKNWTKMLNHIG